jgi:hypothetical protein
VEEVSGKVVWEVEVEEDMVGLLRWAYVGFLLEDVGAHQLQQFFIMDGYHCVRVITLGHRKVLLTSSKEGDIRDIVGSAGWWCKWVDRFVPWSPASVPKHREVWLSCYGVPLLVWGSSFFRALAFKFGSFIEVDDSTNELQRADVARVKVATDNGRRIDSVVEILVLGQKFCIRVMEDGGCGLNECQRCRCGAFEVSDEVVSAASIGGGASVLGTMEGGSEVGSDGDPSQTCQVLLELEKHAGRKGEMTSTRKEVCQEE